ncbi:MAG: DUF3365 domain-containing protein [Campylobacterota bacterium]|nr:DUF3365 domain-containing protein [Campylobacterota bacterium]
MSKNKFIGIVLIFIIVFLGLSSFYYSKTREIVMNNAYLKIDDMLLNYKAVRQYVSKQQKEEVFHLQREKVINLEYFHPVLLSSSYSAKQVNQYYNIFRKEDNKKPITIRFASDNPRNLTNKATAKEMDLLKKFNNKEIESYSELLDTDDGMKLYYVLPTEPTTQKCMRCHSHPKKAPIDLVEMYGDKNGFYEDVGKIRAVLTTIYPIDEDLKDANTFFISLTILTFIIFTTILILLRKFLKQVDKKKKILESLNSKLDVEVKQRTQELEDEKSYIKTILDSNPDIILVTNGRNIVTANKIFYDFFNINTLEDFKKEYNCICDYITRIDDKIMSEDNKIDDKDWMVYLKESDISIHTAEIKKDEEIYNFNINHAILKHNRLLTLQNTTEMRKKENLLYEQSKIASMGEMIGNIAHQWRQPLSVISTVSTGMELEQEYGILNSDKIITNCKTIDENAQYLSKTIDDFRDFLKNDSSSKELFYIEDNLNTFYSLVEASRKSHNIEMYINIKDNIELNSYPNQLLQVYINLFHNSKDAFDKNSLNKVVIIDVYKDEDNLVILYKDNAGGIPLDVLPKIFEPYFSTKHKSQGTGLGLHMTYNIIKSFQGSIESLNTTFIYNEKEYNGASFIIKLPIRTKE